MAVAIVAVGLARDIAPTAILTAALGTDIDPQLATQLAPPVILKLVGVALPIVKVPLLAATLLPEMVTEAPLAKELFAVTSVLRLPF